MGKILLLFAGWLILPLPVFAARPLSTNDAPNVEKGKFEVEYGIEYVNGFDNETALCLVVTRGLLECLDLGVEVPYVFIDAKESSDSDGFSDITISTKFNFLKDSEFFPDSALSFAYTTDSGNNDKGLGTGKHECALTAIFSQPFKSAVMHLNLGYAFKEDFEDADNEDVFTYGLAFEYPFSDKFNLVGEISGETEFENEFNDNPCNALVGLNYALSEDIVWDFGLATEISGIGPDFKVISGITCGF